MIIERFEEQILFVNLFEEEPVGFDPIILRGVRNREDWIDLQSFDQIINSLSLVNIKIVHEDC